MNVKEGFAPGTHGCHEALHMTSFLTDTIDRELCEHEAIMANPDWLRQAEMARDLLARLYDKIGREHISCGEDSFPV